MNVQPPAIVLNGAEGEAGEKYYDLSALQMDYVSISVRTQKHRGGGGGAGADGRGRRGGRGRMQMVLNCCLCFPSGMKKSLPLSSRRWADVVGK